MTAGTSFFSKESQILQASIRNVREMAGNVKKRAELCMDQQGEH